jgi:inner membrane protein
MDSLSQIVLGAATGEAVLGKKLGNRALLWGAIGGTIPDLDVLGKFFLDPLANLAFHRGISHSVLFWFVGALLIAWPVSRRSQVRYKAWVGFFFATFATHVLLDCFTLYGTQLWAPFASTRIAWSTISVADPLYTFPFLAFLLVLRRSPKGSTRRQKWHRWAWGWSCGYLLLTVVNKQHVESVFADALSRQGIVAERMVTTPTILNNVLWSATADASDAYYLAQYSLFDSSPVIFHRVEKGQEHWLYDLKDPTMSTLHWFSDGYLHASPLDPETNKQQLSDLRFGSFSGLGASPDDFIFRLEVEDAGDHYTFSGAGGGPTKEQQEQFFPALWSRIRGR